MEQNVAKKPPQILWQEYSNTSRENSGYPSWQHVPFLFFKIYSHSTFAKPTNPNSKSQWLKICIPQSGSLPIPSVVLVEGEF